MKKGIKEKMISAASVVVFFALVRPSEIPAMWVTVLLAFALYEGILLGMAFARDVRKSQRRRSNAHYRHEDAVRWAEEWFNPIREVRG